MVQGGRVLTIKRSVGTRTYFVLPGGGVEPGESVEAACVREAREETGFGVRIVRELFAISGHDRTEHYFVAEPVEGTLQLGGPEARRNTPENRYELVWMSAPELETVPLVPEPARRACCELLIVVAGSQSPSLNAKRGLRSQGSSLRTKSTDA
jgi:8-oxo-dGTP diphosphatase